MFVRTYLGRRDSSPQAREEILHLRCRKRPIKSLHDNGQKSKPSPILTQGHVLDICPSPCNETETSGPIQWFQRVGRQNRNRGRSGGVAKIGGWRAHRSWALQSRMMWRFKPLWLWWRCYCNGELDPNHDFTLHPRLIRMLNHLRRQAPIPYEPE